MGLTDEAIDGLSKYERAVKDLRSAYEELQTTVGQRVIPILSSGIKGLTQAIETVNARFPGVVIPITTALAGAGVGYRFGGPTGAAVGGIVGAGAGAALQGAAMADYAVSQIVDMITESGRKVKMKRGLSEYFEKPVGLGVEEFSGLNIDKFLSRMGTVRSEVDKIKKDFESLPKDVADVNMEDLVRMSSELANTDLKRVKYVKDFYENLKVIISYRQLEVKYQEALSQYDLMTIQDSDKIVTSREKVLNAMQAEADEAKKIVIAIEAVNDEALKQTQLYKTSVTELEALNTQIKALRIETINLATDFDTKIAKSLEDINRIWIEQDVLTGKSFGSQIGYYNTILEQLDKQIETAQDRRYLLEQEGVSLDTIKNLDLEIAQLELGRTKFLRQFVDDYYNRQIAILNAQKQIVESSSKWADILGQTFNIQRSMQSTISQFDRETYLMKSNLIDLVRNGLISEQEYNENLAAIRSRGIEREILVIEQRERLLNRQTRIVEFQTSALNTQANILEKMNAPLGVIAMLRVKDIDLLQQQINLQERFLRTLTPGTEKFMQIQEKIFALYEKQADQVNFIRNNWLQLFNDFAMNVPEIHEGLQRIAIPLAQYAGPAFQKGAPFILGAGGMGGMTPFGPHQRYLGGYQRLHGAQQILQDVTAGMFGFGQFGNQLGQSGFSGQLQITINVDDNRASLRSNQMKSPYISVKRM